MGSRRLSSNQPPYNILETRYNSTENFSVSEAARVIQKAWRSHMDRQIFLFYKNLIGFHTQGLAKSVVHSRQIGNDEASSKSDATGDTKNQLVTANGGQCASTIMKLICPKEAEFMDEAAGTHIRFRLASPNFSERYGSFPPAVYYKIYTHRPVVDLCATAPRDYTKAQNKVKLPMQRFNSIKETTTAVQNLMFPGQSSQGWYRRFENNSWRPISDKMLLASLYTAPLSSFKPTVAQRRVKRATDKKRKRIAWLRKMYFSNDNGFTDDELVEDAIESMAYAIGDSSKDGDLLGDRDVNIGEIIDDDDVQALIEWTCCLDYSDYSNYWSHLGTAGFPSIEILGEKSQARASTKQLSYGPNGESFTESSFNASTAAAPEHNEIPAMSETAPPGMDYWTLDQLEAN